MCFNFNAIKDDILELSIIYRNCIDEAETITNKTDLEILRSKYIGIGGILTEKYKTLGKYQTNERKELGYYLNRTKNHIDALIKCTRIELMNKYQLKVV